MANIMRNVTMSSVIMSAKAMSHASLACSSWSS